MIPLVSLPVVGQMPVAALFALATVLLMVAAFATGWYRASGGENSRDLEVIEGLEGGDGFQMTSYGPSDDVGLLQTYLRSRKKRKALSKGMVRWHLVDSSFSKPKYIKPEREEGGNIPEVKMNGETYCFPEDATVPSEEEGVPVVVHRAGESDPINLRDSWEDAVDAGTLSQYLTLRVTSKKPKTGLLDGLGLGGGWDPMTVFRYGLLAIIGFAVLMETMGGGLY